VLLQIGVFCSSFIFSDRIAADFFDQPSGSHFSRPSAGFSFSGFPVGASFFRFTGQVYHFSIRRVLFLQISPSGSPFFQIHRPESPFFSLSCQVSLFLSLLPGSPFFWIHRPGSPFLSLSRQVALFLSLLPVLPHFLSFSFSLLFSFSLPPVGPTCLRPPGCGISRARRACPTPWQSSAVRRACSRCWLRGRHAER